MERSPGPPFLGGRESCKEGAVPRVRRGVQVSCRGASKLEDPTNSLVGDHRNGLPEGGKDKDREDESSEARAPSARRDPSRRGPRTRLGGSSPQTTSEAGGKKTGGMEKPAHLAETLLFRHLPHRIFHGRNPAGDRDVKIPFAVPRVLRRPPHRPLRRPGRSAPAGGRPVAWPALQGEPERAVWADGLTVSVESEDSWAIDLRSPFFP